MDGWDAIVKFLVDNKADIEADDKVNIHATIIRLQSYWPADRIHINALCRCKQQNLDSTTTSFTQSKCELVRSSNVCAVPVPTPSSTPLFFKDLATPLHLAAEGGNLQLLECLVRNGANLLAKKVAQLFRWL